MKSYRLTEVKSYNVPFVRLPRPVFWFNDPFEAGTWSDLHRHEHWGELAFMRSGMYHSWVSPGGIHTALCGGAA